MATTCVCVRGGGRRLACHYGDGFHEEHLCEMSTAHNFVLRNSRRPGNIPAIIKPFVGSSKAAAKTWFLSVRDQV